MFFGVPPHNQDPSYEGEYNNQTPKERLERVIYGLAVVTVIVVIAAVVTRVL